MKLGQCSDLSRHSASSCHVGEAAWCEGQPSWRRLVAFRPSGFGLLWMRKTLGYVSFEFLFSVDSVQDHVILILYFSTLNGSVHSVHQSLPGNFKSTHS